jgi:hypothetical protein
MARRGTSRQEFTAPWRCGRVRRDVGLVRAARARTHPGEDHASKKEDEWTQQVARGQVDDGSDGDGRSHDAISDAANGGAPLERDSGASRDEGSQYASIGEEIAGFETRQGWQGDENDAIEEERAVSMSEATLP